MKNPPPDKRFFHFFEKILNGQAEDLSQCGSVCSHSRALCQKNFQVNRRRAEKMPEPRITRMGKDFLTSAIRHPWFFTAACALLHREKTETADYVES